MSLIFILRHLRSCVRVWLRRTGEGRGGDCEAGAERAEAARQRPEAEAATGEFPNTVLVNIKCLIIFDLI